MCCKEDWACAGQGILEISWSYDTRSIVVCQKSRVVHGRRLLEDTQCCELFGTGQCSCWLRSSHGSNICKIRYTRPILTKNSQTVAVSLPLERPQAHKKNTVVHAAS